MKIETINGPIRFIVRWSPLFFVLSLVWAFIAWRNQAISPYLFAYVAIGLICGALVIINHRYNSSTLMNGLSYLIFYSAPTILDGLVFPNPDPNFVPMRPSSQYVSVVFLSIMSLVVILRQRITRFIAKRDAEQTLGADSPLSSLYL